MELVRPLVSALSQTHERSAVSENEFHLLYQRTARPLRAYLHRMLNDVSRADDLLQETYLRFLQAKLPAGITDDHTKNYLYKIATNLLRKEWSAHKSESLGDHAHSSDTASQIVTRADADRHLAQLTTRQRELLWLAYVEQFSHVEIAAMLKLKTTSIRPLLARARERLSEILKGAGRGRQ